MESSVKPLWRLSTLALRNAAYPTRSTARRTTSFGVPRMIAKLLTMTTSLEVPTSIQLVASTDEL